LPKKLNSVKILKTFTHATPLVLHLLKSDES